MEDMSENPVLNTKPLLNILIVDDMPVNLLLLERMLAERGYKPRPVISGKLALEAARAEPPDLILLDINMPDMNGYELCKQLKADTALKDIPVIFISALGETIDKVRAFNVGGVDYVTKPFQCEEVYARIQTHLKLHQLEKLRDTLTHMIVHDLRNPLTVVSGFLDILKYGEAQKLSANIQELLKAARRSTKDLLNMISSILDVSKMGADEMKLQYEQFCLDILIRTVLDTTQPFPGDRTVAFEASGSSLAVTADIVLIRRVLQNLLSNALKYTPQGGGIRIVITASPPSQVRVAVTDTGPGIAPKYHQRIFEKFAQIEDQNNRMGTGLGLAFCKMAVEAHGGSIGVESEIGRGSTFWFTLKQHETTLTDKGGTHE